jgi:hypothetical protein
VPAAAAGVAAPATAAAADSAAFSIPVDAAPVAAFAAPAPPTAPRPKPSDLSAVLGDFSLEVSRLREEQEQQTSKAREHEGQVEDAALVLAQKRRRLHETEEQIEAVSILLCTVTFHANLAHSLTRSP